MPARQSDIDRLMKSFYDENMLSDFIGSPVFYFAYVDKHKITQNGVTKEKDIIKFGQSRKIQQRDLEEHRKFYKVFNVIGIWKTLANIEVEQRVNDNFKSLNMLIKLKIQGKNKKAEENKNEHIILDEVHNLDYCLNMIENVVRTTSLPQENEYKK